MNKKTEDETLMSSAAYGLLTVIEIELFIHNFAKSEFADFCRVRMNLDQGKFLEKKEYYPVIVEVESKDYYRCILHARIDDVCKLGKKFLLLDRDSDLPEEFANLLKTA